MILLNGWTYSSDEIKAALEKKGYQFVTFSFTDIEEVGNHYMQVEVPRTILCAVKEGEEPSRDNSLYDVARREFVKPKVRPELV